MTVSRVWHPRARPARPAAKLLIGEDFLPVRPARRALDIVVASVLLVLTAPLVLTAMIAIAVTDGRPVLFRHLRVGEGARPFPVLKLRTMRSRPGSAVTTTEDARITRLGRVLRRTSVDELPQLVHVLQGRMTLVGPRPETVELAARYPASSRPLLAARPGLTGPAQLAYRERSAVPPPGWDVESWYLEVLVPLRAQADLDYVCRPTLRHTVLYLFRTAAFVVGLRDYQRAIEWPARSEGRIVTGSEGALTHSPVVRSNSKSYPGSAARPRIEVIGLCPHTGEDLPDPDREGLSESARESL